MKKVVVALVFLVLGMVPSVHASMFTLQSYTVSLHNADPGLVVYSRDLLPEPSNFVLNTVGQTYSTALFKIGTRETALNFDDWMPYGINVNFLFSQPLPTFGGNTNGITGAGWFGKQIGTVGYVGWDNPLQLSFGTTGRLGVTLSNEVFDLPGEATITARFQLLRADAATGPPPQAVPEPASLLLFGLGITLASRKLRQTRS